MPHAQCWRAANDPERWQVSSGGSKAPLADLTFGADAEDAYHDALLALLPGYDGKKRPPAQHEYLDSGDGRGGGPHGTEGWFQASQWRRDRRRAGRQLRRELVGY